MAAGQALDPYAVLRVPRNASEAEIRAAYRELVARYHPDKHQGNPLEDLAAERMAEINRAYEILSNPARRAAFDRGPSPFRVSPGAAPFPGFPAGKRLNPRVVKILWVLLALPLVLRFGRLLMEAVGALGRALLGASELVQGTPVAAALVLLALLFLVFTLLRRRRGKAKGKGG